MGRTLVVLLALAAGLTPVARAAPQAFEHPRIRALLDGGLAIPFYFPVPSYRAGAGAGLGLELLMSDQRSFVARAEYDHASAKRNAFKWEHSGTADMVMLSFGMRFHPHREGRVHEYAEASFGGGFQRLTERLPTYPNADASALEVMNRGAALFAIGGGIGLRTGARHVIFLESSVVYLMYLMESGGASQLRAGSARHQHAVGDLRPPSPPSGP